MDDTRGEAGTGRKALKVPLLAGDNANAAMCVPCGGRCCRRQPGGLVPADIAGTGNDLAGVLTAMVQSGRYVVDVYVGDPFKGDEESRWDDPDAYFVRPAKVWEENELLGLPVARCTFLGKSGCTLVASDRPYECRALVPDLGGKCRSVNENWNGKRSLAQAWWEHQALLASLLVVTQDEESTESAA